MKIDLVKVGNNHWTKEDLSMLWSNKFVFFFLNRNNVIYVLLIMERVTNFISGVFFWILNLSKLRELQSQLQLRSVCNICLSE